ncbi:sulfurtransferase [Gluconacetobacter entanii]|uniref:sulfurtransferase n=1 Tax=Gluconacetobacter entanii TaxID=108528 RepID=UPI001C93596A|nr:sulfurtransferase [Gluconacetobacter entanii]MBY4641004.1 sulfurtransferase [Gluconacetobacter entanii]MCW4581010.1 sulfurtransferase [Gluconacetobacter entanii]MCW4584321.1 sulfurtransferase [Gluconacetobacter entanii]MCW4587735.1 sulfurtransferase [Gluconacetobacter entanii]
MHPLISAEDLDRCLSHDDVVILDATQALPGQKFDPQTCFLSGHIPGARRFDIDAFSDPDSPLLHTVPGQARFTRLARALGLHDGARIIFYDQKGVACAARGWWLMGLFGHDRTQVLDGGLPAWQEAGLRLETGPTPVPAQDTPPFVARPRMRRLKGLGDMLDIVHAPGSSLILDARAHGRFTGEQPEPRAGTPSGHMPGATSMPYTTLLTADGRMRPPHELRQVFAAAGMRPDREAVCTCGSGMTACVLALGLVAAGLGQHAVYDGSWAEWASTPGTPIVTRNA